MSKSVSRDQASTTDPNTILRHYYVNAVKTISPPKSPHNGSHTLSSVDGW